MTASIQRAFYHVHLYCTTIGSSCSRSNRYLAVFVFLLCMPIQSFAALTQDKIGVFPGYANATGVQAFHDFENWLGYNQSFVTMNIDNSNWSNFEASSWGIFTNTTAWRNVPYARPCITVPLNVGGANAGSTAGINQIQNELMAVANGDFDAHYRKIARDMINAGFANAIIRLGHEGDFIGYPHSFQGGNHAEYIAAFRHVHNVLLSVSGADFLFDYNSNGRFLDYGALGYPGDAYVDIIGLDFYDKAPWHHQETKLQAHLDFAISHGKPVSYPEFGLADPAGCQQSNPDFCGQGDNPTFIQNVYDWLDSLPDSGPGSLVYANYFNGNSTANTHNLDRYPNSKAKFKQLFGALQPGQGSGGPTISPTSPNVQLFLPAILNLLLE